MSVFTPKSVALISDLIRLSNSENGTVLDPYAGSGTTGHAVIHLNREGLNSRRFILIEMGVYFDTVLLPRLKKVTFAPEWKNGKPLRLTNAEEDDQSPRIIKVLRLESYEDALNNLELRRSESQDSLLKFAEAQGPDGLREHYLLRYMLDVETRGSQSLLNISAFNDPTAYRLKVKRPGSEETREMNVDLLETFNWLIGLTVESIAAPQTVTASFKPDNDPDLPKDGPRRLLLDGRVREDSNGLWWFRTVSGTTPDGRKTLVIWRKLTNNQEQDNLVLDEWFKKQGYSSKDSEFDLIYVNGDNNLENQRKPDDTWKVRLIEEDFHRLMFEETEM
jgi:adenine-specific DNA-methyltransferase